MPQSTDKSRRGDLIIAGVIFGMLVIFMLVIANSGSSSRSKFADDDLSAYTGDCIGEIEIIGPIFDSRKWCKDIDKFRTKSNVKAILIRIDSPGGGIAASQELYEAIKRAREKKPVVVSMGGVAASGGYYAAIGADTIVANSGTTTGSIGVLIEITQFYDLMNKIGVKSELITSGEYKGAGNPFNKLTAKERAYFQSYIDDAYQQFIEAVAEERGLDLKSVKKYADGRVFTGRQAKEFGLVDELGDRYYAIQLASEMCGLGASPKVIKPVKRLKDMDLLDLLLEKSMHAVERNIASRPAFQYRWTPGD